MKNLNKSIDLISSKKITQLSKIQKIVFQNFNVNPRILISELESMPEIDLIELSSSIENTTYELGKNISSLSENIENASNEVEKMTEKLTPSLVQYLLRLGKLFLLQHLIWIKLLK